MMAVYTRHREAQVGGSCCVEMCVVRIGECRMVADELDGWILVAD